jgi:hypothetical protein
LIIPEERRETFMDPDIQALITEVTADETVEASAVTLINGIAAEIVAAVAAASSLSSADRATLEATTAAFTVQANALAAAVAANTPAVG